MSPQFEFRDPKPRPPTGQNAAGYYDDFLRDLRAAKDAHGRWTVIREGISASVLASKLRQKYGKDFDFEYELDGLDDKPNQGTVFARFPKETS